MSGERAHWQFLVGAAVGFVSVATIFGSLHAAIEHAVVVAVRPSVVVSRCDFQQLLRWSVIALLGRVQLRITVVEIVAAVLGGEERMETRVPRESDGVANAGRKTVRNVVALMQACRIIAPNSSSQVELRTRVESASRGVTGVRIGADVDEEIPGVVEREAAAAMPAIGKSSNDGVGRSNWSE